MTNKEKVYNALRGEGLSLALVCGIMANIQRESNYNPNAKGDSGTSYGLCQWHKGRWELLKSYCSERGISSAAIESQVKFLIWEFKQHFTSAWNTMMVEPDTAQGAYNAAYTMCVKYEIPASKETKGKQRGEIASQLYAERLTSDTAYTEYSHYVIQSGDTLTRIAARFGVAITDIISLNPSITDPDRITAGAVLTLPKVDESSPEENKKRDIVSQLQQAISAIEDVIEWLST